MAKTTLAIAVALLGSGLVFAHCDSLDGPVVIAARAALAAGDVRLVLPWVRGTDEPEIKQAFDRTVLVRKLNLDAHNLADTWFFETVVRVHRAGEGAPYQGLKPAGRDLGPAIPAADKAIVSGSLEALEKMLTGLAREQLSARFESVKGAKAYSATDVAAGRKYVAAYVDFVHFVERLHQVVGSLPGHSVEHEH